MESSIPVNEPMASNTSFTVVNLMFRDGNVKDVEASSSMIELFSNSDMTDDEINSEINFYL